MTSATAQMWASVAGSWQQHAAFVDARHEQCTKSLLERVAPVRGDEVIDLACGPGGVTLAVAPIVDPGRVIASDLTTEMADLAVARAHRQGLSNVRGLRIDIEAIELPDESLDLALCRDGLQFAADPATAVAEIARALRPRGRAGIVVWAERERNPWLAALLDALSDEIGMPVPPPGVHGPFELGDGHRLEALFVDAGFADVRVEEVPVPLRAPSFDAWWQMTTSLAGPLALVIAGLDEATREGVRTRASHAIADYATADGALDIPGVAHVLTAHRR